MQDALKDNKLWDNIHHEFMKREATREEIISLSRLVIQSSKKIIYSLHRGDPGAAKSERKEIKSLVKKLEKIGDQEPIAKVAWQEYVEAECFYGAVVMQSIPNPSELGVSDEAFLFGLTDLCGELNRAAVNAAIQKDAKKASLYKDMVEQIYGRMLMFDFRNGELRKKFDGIKYELKKLENLMLELSLRGING